MRNTAPNYRVLTKPMKTRRKTKIRQKMKAIERSISSRRKQRMMFRSMTVQ
jgi:hypothetical protein